MLGDRGGAVGQAWVTALATPSAGHAPFVVVVVVLPPGLPVLPFTLFVNKARLEDDDHARMTWGPAQAGVAAGVADVMAAGTIDEAAAAGLVVIAAVWVDPEARDAELVFANNRETPGGALALGRAGLPSAGDVVAQRESAWNPFYRPDRLA